MIKEVAWAWNSKHCRGKNKSPYLTSDLSVDGHSHTDPRLFWKKSVVSLMRQKRWPFLFS
jgi:hypothetical protein